MSHYFLFVVSSDCNSIFLLIKAQ
jgi:hypothetical protein